MLWSGKSTRKNTQGQAKWTPKFVVFMSFSEPMSCWFFLFWGANCAREGRLSLCVCVNRNHSLLMPCQLYWWKWLKFTKNLSYFTKSSQSLLGRRDPQLQRQLKKIPQNQICHGVWLYGSLEFARGELWCCGSMVFHCPKQKVGFRFRNNFPDELHLRNKYHCEYFFEDQK